MSKPAATLTIHDAPNMTTQGKKAVADWLRRQAKALITDGDMYSNKTVIRYLYK